MLAYCAGLTYLVGGSSRDLNSGNQVPRGLFLMVYLEIINPVLEQINAEFNFNPNIMKNVNRFLQIMFTMWLISNPFSNIQAQSLIPCVYHAPILHPSPAFINPVHDADELYKSLSYLYGNTCSNPVTVTIAKNFDIQLGDLNPDVFPLEIPMGVTLEGNFDLGLVTRDGISYGTKIYFPWLYEYGMENTIPSFGCWSPIYNDDFSSAFKMLDNAAIRQICLIGPRTDTKDWRFGEAIGKYRDRCTGKGLPPLEGLNSGILVSGNNCEVSYCEIYGFGHYGVQVRDIVSTNNSGGISTPTDCFDINIDETGKFFFHHNYIHNCKAYGYGYGLWVSAGSGVDKCDRTGAIIPCLTNIDDEANFFNYIKPEEIAYIHDNVFF